MSNNINHWCVVCGKGYHSCDSCNEINKFNAWQKFACTSNHYRIFRIIDDYYNKVITVKQARKMLDKCDLNGWENFAPNIVDVIKDILLYECKAKQPKKVQLKEKSFK